jgi:hypothetical protein
MTPRTRTVTVAACAIPNCDREASEGCLGCDVRFCGVHSFEHATRVSTEFSVTPLDCSSCQPDAPFPVVLCEKCRKKPQALDLIELYRVANDAIKRAGESIMPVIKTKYPSVDK